MKFTDLNLIEPIQKAITETGYTTPTPIQQQAIPLLLEGRDLLGCAQTGTGKTAAFALPMLNYLAQSHLQAQADGKTHSLLKPRLARSLILTPTRELAVQIFDSFKTYGKNLKLSYAVVFGGVSQVPQVEALSKGVDVLIATPGRLLDLIVQRHVSLNALEIFVLDEADRMLDMGFVQDIKRIIKMLPQKRQNLFFSATMPSDILDLAHTMLFNPARVEVAPVSSTVDVIEQSVMYVDKERKRDLLVHVLKDPKFSKVIVFTRTKHGANRVVQVLERNRILAAAIHGNKSQGARQTALENLRSGKVRVLVATDIAARGIDIDNISHVINFEIPNIAESYVHRIGRTARAGAQGIAISFCDAEEKSFIRDIEKLIKKTIPVDSDQPYHSEVVENSRLVSSGKAKAMIEARNESGEGRGPRQYTGRRKRFGGGAGGGKRHGGSGGAGGSSRSGSSRSGGSNRSGSTSSGPSRGASQGGQNKRSGGPSRGSFRGGSGR